MTSLESAEGEITPKVIANDGRCFCLSCYLGSAQGLQSMCFCNMFDIHVLFVNFIRRCSANKYSVAEWMLSFAFDSSGLLM